MSTHVATVRWERTSTDFTYNSYNRAHTWAIAGQEILASSAPEFRGDSMRVNPEEAFVASLSSCHMLTFLAIAARKGIPVERYTDTAEGTLELQNGKLRMTRVVLRPYVEFGGTPPSVETLKHMHVQSHADCFIANSVTTEVLVEPE